MQTRQRGSDPWDFPGGLMIDPMIINLTRHDIQILVPGEVVTIPASGHTARLDIANKGLGFTRRGIHISQSEIKGSLGLPKEEEGIYYIVSSLLASQCPERSDLPCTRLPHHSHIVGGTACRGLTRFYA